MKVPLLDLQAQHATIKEEIDEAVQRVIDSQFFILGPEVAACESEIAQYAHCAHGVGVSSGSDALLVALMALDIGPGDEVITTPYTFFATVGAIVRVGARPVFVDIDPVTHNIDSDQIEQAVTDKTRAIIPVHLFGRMCEMDIIMAIANKHGLAVIEDAAQAIGAEYKGQRAGAIGTVGCFSFFPSKNLGAAGDGGMVVTQDATLADKVRCLRAHGSSPKYYHKLVGGNFRLDALQAAIVRVKLKHLDEWTAARQRHADTYNTLFKESGLVESGALTLPGSTDGVRHIYNQYVIRTSQRDNLMAYFKESEIGCAIYYPRPMHIQACFNGLGYQQGDFPESEKASQESLAIPVSPEVSRFQQNYVVNITREFFGKG